MIDLIAKRFDAIFQKASFERLFTSALSVTISTGFFHVGALSVGKNWFPRTSFGARSSSDSFGMGIEWFEFDKVSLSIVMPLQFIVVCRYWYKHVYKLLFLRSAWCCCCNFHNLSLASLFLYIVYLLVFPRLLFHFYLSIFSLLLMQSVSKNILQGTFP